MNELLKTILVAVGCIVVEAVVDTLTEDDEDEENK